MLCSLCSLTNNMDYRSELGLESSEIASEVNIVSMFLWMAPLITPIFYLALTLYKNGYTIITPTL